MNVQRRDKKLDSRPLGENLEGVSLQTESADVEARSAFQVHFQAPRRDAHPSALEILQGFRLGRRLNHVYAGQEVDATVL